MMFLVEYVYFIVRFSPFILQFAVIFSKCYIICKLNIANLTPDTFINHPFIFVRLALKQNEAIRDEVATANSLQQFRSCVNRLKATFEPYHMGQAVWMENNELPKDYNLSLPPWICQQYIRRPPEEHIEFLAQKQKEAAEREKTDYFDDDGKKISKKVLKRLRRAAQKQNADGLRQKQTSRGFELCSAVKCANPTVIICVYIFAAM